MIIINISTADAGNFDEDDEVIIIKGDR